MAEGHDAYHPNVNFHSNAKFCLFYYPVTQQSMDFTDYSIEHRVRITCKASHNDSDAYLMHITDEFNVLYHTLQARLKGRPSKITTDEKNKKLSQLQKATLIEYIKRLKNLEINVRSAFLTNTANKILHNDHYDPTILPLIVDQSWPRCFLTCHPKFF